MRSSGIVTEAEAAVTAQEIEVKEEKT